MSVRSDQRMAVKKGQASQADRVRWVLGLLETGPQFRLREDSDFLPEKVIAPVEEKRSNASRLPEGRPGQRHLGRGRHRGQSDEDGAPDGPRGLVLHFGHPRMVAEPIRDREDLGDELPFPPP